MNGGRIIFGGRASPDPELLLLGPPRMQGLRKLLDHLLVEEALRSALTNL